MDTYICKHYLTNNNVFFKGVERAFYCRANKLFLNGQKDER